MAAPLPFDLNEVDPVDGWKPWLPAKNEWSRKWAAHLFRRAAFGAKPSEIDRALVDGFPKTLERLLVGAPDADKSLEFFTEVGQYCKEATSLRVWWLRFMVEGGHPLREKLTLFWHNHFATSIAKVREITSMFEQNITLRKHALGKFRPFLLEMNKNPAILLWLDSNQNVKEAPNENYARELMELFSLGVGNYTEKDIREAARAFTGWHTNSAPNGEAFEFNPSEHDEGLKTVFGRIGNWDGTDIIRLCCDQSACAKFLVGKLYTFLVSEAPPPKGLLNPLVERFRKSEYDIADLVKTMLGSRLFFSAHAYRKRVKWPVEYAIEAIRSLVPGQMRVSNLTDPLAGMGQVLFAPPNVKGWRTGTDWLNSATLLARNNFAEIIAVKDRAAPDQIPPTPTSIPTAVDDPTDPSAGFTVPLNSDPIIHLPTGSSNSPLDDLFEVLPDLLGASRLSNTSSSTEVDVDPITTLYTTKPNNVSGLVQRMSELLFGERLSPTQTARIEQFLREPLVPLKSPTPGQSPNPTPSPNGSYIPSLPATEPIPPPGADHIPFSDPLPVLKKPPLAVAPPPREVTVKPGKFDLESREFKARVREALHAMMCLPEYQLN